METKLDRGEQDKAHLLISNHYMTRAFPSHLYVPSRTMAGALPPDPEMSNQSFFRVNFEGDVLVIPERIYSDLRKLRVRSPLSEEERIILHCLLSRHTNGY